MARVSQKEQKDGGGEEKQKENDRERKRETELFLINLHFTSSITCYVPSSSG